MKSDKKFNEGFSLVEVIIAIVILAIAGVALLQLLQGSGKTNRVLTNKSVAVVTLNTAFNTISNFPALPCKPTVKDQPNPLTSLPLGNNVEITAFQGLTTSNSWADCASWSPGAGDPIVTKIKFQVKYYLSKKLFETCGANSTKTECTNNIRVLEQEVVKTGSTDKSPVKIVLTPSKTSVIRNGTDSITYAISTDSSSLSCGDLFFWVSSNQPDLNTLLSGCNLVVKAPRDIATWVWKRSGSVTVTAIDLGSKKILSGGTVSLEITYPAPTISGFVVTNPSGVNNACIRTGGCGQAGRTGDNVAIAGTYLFGNNNDTNTNPAVNFTLNKNASVVGIASDNSVRVTVPSGVTTGSITLQTQSATSGTSPSQFEVIGVPALNNSGYVYNKDPESSVSCTGTTETADCGIAAFQEISEVPGGLITIFMNSDASLISGVRFSGSSSTIAPTGTSGALVNVAKGSSSFTVQVPSDAIKGPITVYTAAGSDITDADFYPVPRITSMADGSETNSVRNFSTNPASDSNIASGYGSGIKSNGNRSVKIIGAGFLSATALQFSDGNGGWIPGVNCLGGTDPGTASFWYPKSGGQRAKNALIYTCVPSGAKLGKIRAINSAGAGVSPWDFHPEPVIGSFNKTGGGLGTTVTISGSGFTGLNLVVLGGVTLTVTPTPTNDQSVTLTVPTGADDSKITLRTNVDAVISNATYYVKPRISSAVPCTSLTACTTGTLTLNNYVKFVGTGFTQASSTLTINGASSTTTASTTNPDTELFARVTCTSTSGNVNITTPLGSNPEPYSASVQSLPTPTITDYGTNNAGSDKKAVLAKPIQISGSGLGCVTGIKWGGNTYALTTSSTSTALTTSTNISSLPTQSGSLTFVVNNSDVSTTSYLYVPSVPSSNKSWSATSGVRGTGIITVTGTGFGGATSSVAFVKLGATQITNYTSWSDTSISFLIPSGTTAGSYAITITTPNASAVAFTNTCTSCAGTSSKTTSQTTTVLTFSSSANFGYFFITSSGQKLAISGSTISNGTYAITAATSPAVTLNIGTTTGSTRAATSATAVSVTQSTIEISAA